MATFSWKVAVKGYEWVEKFITPELGRGVQAIVPGMVLVPVEWKFRTYQPLKEHSGLFRIFAATPPTLEEIQEFANRYGHLGEGGDWFGGGPNKGLTFDSDEDRADYEQSMELLTVPQQFEDWKEAINRMRKALDLWERVRGSQASPRLLRELQNVVDDQLSEMRVMARFEIAPSPSRQPALHVVPSTLGGAMWLQLAQAIAGNKKYRACEVCGRWFELSPDVARTNRRYCSEACRSRAYRARQERARQLHAAGKTPRQIAKELGSQIEKVKRWVDG